MWKDLTDEEKTRLTVLNDEQEIDGIEQGVARYRRSVEHQDIDRPSRKLIKSVFDRVSSAIEEDQRLLMEGRAVGGRPQQWAAAYLTMDPDKMALITLSCMMSIEDSKLSKTAFTIADRVKLEHEFDEIRAKNRGAEKDKKGFSRNFSALLNDRTKVRKLYKKLCSKPLEWTYNQRLGIGCRLIQQAVMATGLWGIDRKRDGKKTTTWITMSDEIIELVLSSHSELEILRPVCQPMTCPPVDWSMVGNSFVGGYRLIKQPLVRDKFGEHPVDYGKADMHNVLAALNSIQSVEWRIDKRIYDLALSISKSTQYDEVIPFIGTAPKLPPFPTDGTKEQKRIWHQDKAQILAAFKAKASVRMVCMKALRAAGMFLNAPIWFPHNLDWRGRIYPLTSYLSPQGSDLQKALLVYGRRKRLGDKGLRRMKIWAASCAGQDKISIEDRIKWLDDNYNYLKFDPDVDLRWAGYDSPMLFVQAMLELKEAYQTGKPTEFMSCVSVCVDGSQNGLQHLSALGRDAEGGAAVNLTDGIVPSDLYADVADLVYAAVCGDAEMVVATGEVKDEMGQPVPPLVWHPLLEVRKKRRSIVKRSVLAYPYGVTKAGMRDGLIVDGFTDGIAGSRHRNAWYLAEKIDVAVRDVVISAGRLMDWFRKVADDTAKLGKPIAWVAPSGFPVSMHYFVRESKEVRTCLARISVQVPTNDNDVSASAQVRGIVANFIHSLDASHLVDTVLNANAAGITDHQFVHDSFGCHACDVDELGVKIRESFVRMHSNDILKSFIDSVERTGYKTSDLPPSGTLDISAVLRSTFFFS